MAIELPVIDDAFNTTTTSRRQLLKAGAWAAPVIVLATAAPASANASTDPVVPTSAITVTKLCHVQDLTNNRHGFTFANTSNTTATVVVALTAYAWGATKDAAIANVTSVTSTSSGATYGNTPATGGATVSGGATAYQNAWGAISTHKESLVRWGATRSGTLTLTLPPHSSIAVWQQNVNALGEPKVTAVVTSINGKTVTGGGSASFSLVWGTGQCA